MRSNRTSTAIALALALSLALGACTGDGGESAGPTSPAASSGPTATVSAEPSATPSPTPPAIPEQAPATRGPVTLECENGWVTPPPTSPRFLQPLGIVRRTTGVRGPLEVVDMRYFTGPESPPTDKGYLLVVERWYVKLFARDDIAFQGRFLIEARRFGRGLVAVAPYDTTGYRSPDWTGFQFDAIEGSQTYAGLPGEWSGTPYDFVEGGAGLRIPGLPDEVTGCLEGT
jgi:hypothetical protein